MQQQQSQQHKRTSKETEDFFRASPKDTYTVLLLIIDAQSMFEKKYENILFQIVCKWI